MDDELVVALETAGDRLPADELELFGRFAENYWPAIPKRYRGFLQSNDLLNFLLERWEFFKPPISGACSLRASLPAEGKEAWNVNVSIIEARLLDRPFIVDTAKEYFRRNQIEIHLTIHPVTVVERDDSGRIVRIDAAQHEGPREAHVYFHIDRIVEAGGLEKIAADLRQVLEMVCIAVDEYPSMKQQILQVAEDILQRPEAYPEVNSTCEQKRDFMLWSLKGNFTYLGCRWLTPKGDDLVQDEERSFGLFRNGRPVTRTFRDALDQELARDFQAALARNHTLAVMRTGMLSPIHRSEEMDYVSLKSRSEDGAVTCVFEVVGLFTSTALLEKPDRIPLIRDKLGDVMSVLGFLEDSHSHKLALSIVHSLPKEFLFNSTSEDLREEVETLMNAEDGSEILISLRAKPDQERLIATISMPEQNYSAGLRDQLLAHLQKTLKPTLMRDYHCTGEMDTSRLHIYLFNPSFPEDSKVLWEIEQELEQMVRTWKEKLGEAIEAMEPGPAGKQLARKYCRALPDVYGNYYDIESALWDIRYLEELEVVDPPRVGIFRYQGMTSGKDVTEVRLFETKKVSLSRIMPILSNAGLHVVDEFTTELQGRGSNPAIIHAFEVLDAAGEQIPTARMQPLSEMLLKVLQGRCESDPLNALVLGAGLDWRGAEVLVTYRNLMLQVSRSYSREAANSALLKHPDASRALFVVFDCKFNPDFSGDREAAVVDAGSEFFRQLDKVSEISADRILRNLFQSIGATLRTNFFLKDREGISIKVSSPNLPEIPSPKPHCEIFVHGPGVEGVHLRGGKVARGGLRWSDRPDDFRTEILGLMKAQMVKNSVIVPVGSKGGFVLKRHFAARDRMQQEMSYQYKVFIGGLLDLTDNIVMGETVHPAGVVCADDPDPYLVVAADKGTAVMSDTANEISKAYKFWMGDAFASGGTHGYSHKEMGITARGAWVCVTRHFRELGVDLEKKEITVVGIGDMSGDVFGNGMLLSEKIKLVAAFDHRHIFIDPEPDPGPAWKERKRLFELPRSSWEDYDRKLISEGGGIFERGAKTIHLSAEARALLGVDEDTFNGNELIRACLRARCDLLWNGGIGTYIKSGRETALDVGDKANDDVRINATKVRAKVIGEGGNLGITQSARLEFTRKGGRINTDAIDNSGGVDCSDREVNLKILFQHLMEEDLISGEAERNRILMDVKEAVSGLVLHTNYLQGALMSMDQIRSKENMEPFIRLIDFLVEQGCFARAADKIPPADELRAPPYKGMGMPRPMLASLAGWAKKVLYDQILESPLPDRPYYNKYFVEYLPQAVWDRFGEECLKHRLRREIIATNLANRVLNQAGIAFVVQLREETGDDVSEIVRAYTLVNDLLQGDRLRVTLHGLDNRVPARWQYYGLLALEKTIFSICRRVLRSKLQREISGNMVKRYAREVREFRKKLRDHVSTSIRTELTREEQTLSEQGFPQELAQEIAAMHFLKPVLTIIRIREQTGASLEQVAGLWYRLGEVLYIHYMSEELDRLNLEDPWDRELATTCSRDLSHYQQVLTSQILDSREEGESPEESLERLLRTRKKPYARLKVGATKLKSAGLKSVVPVQVLMENYEEMREA